MKNETFVIQDQTKPDQSLCYNISFQLVWNVESAQWLADCPAMSFVFVCWHSRNIRLGTLQLAVLRLEKVNWTDFFCKNGISYTNCQWKSKELDKKRAKNPPKRWFFQPLRSAGSVYPEKDRDLFRKSTRSGTFSRKAPGPGPFPEKDPVLFSDKLNQLIGGARKNHLFCFFLPGFCPVLCFFTDNLYIWNATVAKKIGPVDLL